MTSALSTLNTTTEVPLSKAPNPQLLPGHRSLNGCPLLRVCVHGVCVHFGWVICRANIPSMGHHTWPYVTSLHFHVWLLVWGVCADMLVRFSPNVLLCIMAKHLHFGLICSKVIVLENVWFVQMQLCKPKPCCHACLDCFFWQAFQTCHTCPIFSNFTVMNLIISHVNWGLWSLRWSSWVVCHFSEHYMVWSWGECAGMSTPGRIGVCFECLPLVNNQPHCRMLDLKLFGNGCITLPRLMAATIASLRSLLMSYLLGIVLTHTWRLQTSKLFHFGFIFVKWTMTRCHMSCVVVQLRFYFPNFKTRKEPVISFYYVLIRKTMEFNRVP